MLFKNIYVTIFDYFKGLNYHFSLHFKVSLHNFSYVY